jgi:hypothetical protein
MTSVINKIRARRRAVQRPVGGDFMYRGLCIGGWFAAHVSERLQPVAIQNVGFLLKSGISEDIREKR